MATAGAARAVTIYNVEQLERLAFHPDTVTADLVVLRVEPRAPPVAGARPPNVSSQPSGSTSLKRKYAVVTKPFGFTDAFRDAELEVKNVGADVVTVGAAGGVVNVCSGPTDVPNWFVANAQ